MKLYKYVKDKINLLLGFIIYCIVILEYSNAMEINKNAIIVIISISCIFFMTGFFINYWRKNKYIKEIQNVIDNLEEKYLISEVIKKPRMQENLAYYRILKKANKSMIENVTNVRTAQREYKEYIESWVHEIKMPITICKLLCENNKSEITNKIDEEIEEINNYVEQVLFYARLDQVSNDFMIRKINLGDIIRNVLAKNKKLMIQNDMKVENKNIELSAYTDEKWLEFILNQIIINAIKYRKQQRSEIIIEVLEYKEKVKLSIKDNGIGIKKSEIARIFDKGFTGTNGRSQKKSTGIGLYLCKRLCEELGMVIEVKSLENEYTNIIITIPRIKKINES